MLSAVAEMRTPDGQKWLIGADGRMHQEIKGPLTAIIENTRGFCAAWGEKDHEDEVLYWEEKRLPSPGLLRALHDVFFSQYAHETMCWWGIPRKKTVQIFIGKKTRIKAPPVLFFVPTQECSAGSVETVKSAAQAEMECFSKTVRVMGDIHSHPGGGMPSRSGTDVRDMSPSSGFFGIFAQREPKIRWYGGVRNALAELITMDLSKVKPAKDCPLLTLGGCSIDKVVKRKPIRAYGVGNWNKTGVGFRGGSEWQPPKQWTGYKTHKTNKTNKTKKGKGSRRQPRELTLSDELEFFDGWTTRGREDAHVWLIIEDTVPPSTGVPASHLREETILTVNVDERVRMGAFLSSKQLKWIDLGPLKELVQDVWLGATISDPLRPSEEGVIIT